MTTREILKQIFSARSGQLSSKRVIGVLAWLVILGSYIYSGIMYKEMPNGFEFIICAASTLLGVDSVTGAFKHKE